MKFNKGINKDLGLSYTKIEEVSIIATANFIFLQKQNKSTKKINEARANTIVPAK